MEQVVPPFLWDELRHYNGNNAHFISRMHFVQEIEERPYDRAVRRFEHDERNAHPVFLPFVLYSFCFFLVQAYIDGRDVVGKCLGIFDCMYYGLLHARYGDYH
jgi:hypothetical protein